MVAYKHEFLPVTHPARKGEAGIVKLGVGLEKDVCGLFVVYLLTYGILGAQL